MPKTTHIGGVRFGPKCHPVRIGEPRCKRCYGPVCVDLCNGTGVGSDKNVISSVDCHISAALTAFDIRHRAVRGYFEHGGSISNVAVDSGESDAHWSSDARNRNCSGASPERETRHEVATIFCHKQVRAVDSHAYWVNQT